MKAPRYLRDEKGIWKSFPESIVDNHSFLASRLKYLNELDPLFAKAHETSELQFILTLIRQRGYSDPGWDPFESFKRVYDSFRINHIEVVSDPLADHNALFMYGLIVEASAPYNLLANLLNVIEGGHYRVENFPDAVNEKNGHRRPQYPKGKISQIKDRASKYGITITLFDEFFDNDLRNSVFHSDYVIHEGQLRTLQPTRNYSETEWMTLLNKSLAYMDAFLILYSTFRSIYKEPELIDAPEDFIHYPNGKVITIVREGYGLLGIKDNWTDEQLSQGYIPFRLLSCFAYELPLIEEGKLHLPPDEKEKINYFVKRFPRFIRRLLIPICNKYIIYARKRFIYKKYSPGIGKGKI